MLSYVLGRGRFIKITIIQLARGRNWALRVGAAKGTLLVDPVSGGKLGAMHVGPAVHMLQPGSLPFCVHPFGAPQCQVVMQISSKNFGPQACTCVKVERSVNGVGPLARELVDHPPT